MSVKNFLNLTSSITSKGTVGAVTLLATLGMATSAQADNSWTGYTVEHGSVNTDASSTINNTNINVNSRVGIVSGNMDIYAEDTVNLNGTGEIFAFKDNRANVQTQILGKLNAPGSMTVVLVDRNGVMFGADSVVDVGSIVVATGQIDNNQLINGKDGQFGKFDVHSFGDGEINLNGSITVADSGIAAFVSPTVKNNGIIKAKLGKVTLAAAERVTVDLYGDNLIELQAGDALEKALLENNGLINAEGGEIIIAASTAKDTVDSVINMNGVTDVSSATVKGGKIVLSAGKRGQVVVKKHSKTKADGLDGGSIEVTAGKIGITKQVEFSADTNADGNGGAISFDIGTNFKLAQSVISANGAGGRIDFTVGNQLSLASGGRLESEIVNVESAALVLLDGDIDADTITGNASMVRVLGSENGAQINDGIGLAASGATVSVSAGTYNESVNVNKSVTLLGAKTGVAGNDEARGTGETNVNPNSPGFLVTASDVVIDGFTVNRGEAGVIVDSADNVKITNNRFFNQTDPSADGDNFGGPGRGDGVSVANSSNILIDGNRFFGQNDEAVQANGVNNITVSNNAINNTDGDIGVSIAESTGEVNVTGNTIFKAKRHGVVVENSKATINISGNKIQQPGKTGIVSRWNTGKTTISTNTVSDAVTGVSVLDDNNTDIDANTIVRSSGNAIDVAKSKNVNVRENILRTIGGNGINVSKGFGIRVRDNDLIGAEGNGIFIEKNDLVRVTGNRVTGTDKNGIFVKGAYSNKNDDGESIHFDAVIADNKVSSTGKNGIVAKNIGDLRLVDNIVHDVKRNGVSLDGVDYARVRRNNITEAKRNGILASDIGLADFGHNLIREVRYDGISLHDFDAALFIKNDIARTGDDGIDVGYGYAFAAYKNVVTETGFYGNGRFADEDGADGIVVHDVRNFDDEYAIEDTIFGQSVFLLGNDISKTEDDGIEVVDSSGVWIQGNTINEAGYGDGEDYEGADYYGADGIHVRNVRGSSDRPVAALQAVGVAVEDGDQQKIEEYLPADAPWNYDVVIINNDVRVTGDDGIEVVGEENDYKRDIKGDVQSGTGRTLIAWNTVKESGYGLSAEIPDGEGYGSAQDGYGSDAIHVRGVSAQNYPTAAAAVLDGGIYVEGPDYRPDGYGYSVEVLNNNVQTTGDDGIEVRDSGKTIIAGNTVKYTGLDTSYEYDLKNTDKDYGYGANEGDGIKVENVFDRFSGNSVEIVGNKVNHTGDDGVDVHFSGTTLVANNKIRNAGYGEVADEPGRDYDGGDEGWGHDGIHIGQTNGYGEYAVTVAQNDIKTTADDGIEVHMSGRTLIAENKIRNSGYGDGGYYGGADERGADGISAHHIHDNSIRGIVGKSKDGYSGYALEITGNDIKTSADDGIEVEGASSVIIDDNKIKNSGFGMGRPYQGGDIFGSDGIHVRNVWGNHGGHDARQGGFSDGGDYTPYSVVIRGNKVDTSGDDGVQVLFSGDTVVERNKIFNSGTPYSEGIFGGDGINIVTGINLNQEQGQAQDRFSPFGLNITPVSVDVLNNKVSNSNDDGIQVVGATDVLVKKNDVSVSGDDGINVLGFASINVAEREFSDIDELPITALTAVQGDEAQAIGIIKRPYFDPKFKVKIVKNTVTDSGTAFPQDTDESEIAFRTQYKFGERTFGGDGIQVEGFDRAVVRNNTVSNSVENGLYVSGGSNHKVIVSGNTFKDNETGASFESGLVDLTGEANTFEGGNGGLKFSPYQFGSEYDLVDQVASARVKRGPSERDIYGALFQNFRPIPLGQSAELALVDVDGEGGFGGTIGSQIFDGQSGFYIELDNGALFNPGTPTVLDASNASFGSLVPSAQGNVLSAEEFASINSKIFDFRDRNDLGLFFFGAAEDDFVVEQEEVFNAFDPYEFNDGNVQVTILGLPSTSTGGNDFSPTALNSLAPAAGDEEDGELSPEELNNIEAAAGGQSKEAASWSEAIASAQSGGATTFSFGSTLGAGALGN